MVNVAEVEGNLQYLQPHFSTHSTLRGSLVNVQKNFIYFQACSCLSEPPGVEWRRDGWERRAPQPQHRRLLTASCYLLFRNSWSFQKCLLSFQKVGLVNTAATGFAWQQILIFAHLVAFFILSAIKCTFSKGPKYSCYAICVDCLIMLFFLSGMKPVLIYAVAFFIFIPLSSVFPFLFHSFSHFFFTAPLLLTFSCLDKLMY